MCQFLSALVTKDGQVLHASEYTDSHEVLVRYFGYAKNDQQLNDDRRLFVRVEFTPPGDLSTVVDIKKWRFLLDESVAPAWFNKSIEDLVKTKLRNIVKKMLIGGDQDVILGGCYILHGKARISCFYGGVVKLMSGSSQVNEMCNSSQVNKMCDSSQVNKMWDSSKIITNNSSKK